MPSHLILAGPTRTGTTSLFRYLAMQDGFVPSRKKETDFFLDAIRGGKAFSYERYLSEFEDGPSNAWLLEASPLYFAGVRHVAQAIRSTIPAANDVRILITVREPVERIVSLHRHVVTKRNLRESLKPVGLPAFLEQCVDLRSWKFPLAGSISRLGFVEGCYAEGIQQWVDVFGEDSVRLLGFDDLRDDGRSTAALNALCGWLDVSALGEVAMPKENQSRQVKYPSLHRLALAANDRLEASLMTRPRLRGLLRGAYYSLVQSKPKRSNNLDPELRESLWRQYSDCNSGLEACWQRLGLGSNTPDWLNELGGQSRG